MILELFTFTKLYATYGGEFCLSLHFKNLIGYEALRRNYREGGRISQRGNSYLASYSGLIIKWVSVSEYLSSTLDISKVFGPESTVVK